MSSVTQMTPLTPLTPMLRHYSEVKAQHPDTIVLYRMGDFYEVFFDDAVLIAPVLEVALTARHKGKKSEVPMCGVPHHALGVYLGKLVRAGYKVAICDQVEDPAEAKGLVKREVVRVVTPGTVSEPDLLEGGEDNLLAGVVWNAEGGAGAFLDVSTGVFFVRRWSRTEDALQDLRLADPKELLLSGAGSPGSPGSPGSDIPEPVRRWGERRGLSLTDVEEGGWYQPRRARQILEEQFGTKTLRAFGLADGDRGERGDGQDPAVNAAALVLSYARETQHNDLEHIRSLVVRTSAEHLQLDATTLANLEVFRNLRTGSRSGTLMGILDRTVTAPGARLLKSWLSRPLRKEVEIDQRQAAVAELMREEEVRDRVRGLLRSVGDPARLLARAVLGSLTPREAEALRSALTATPAILAEIGTLEGSLAGELAQTDPVVDLQAELARVLAETPSLSVAKGGVIAAGVDSELDRYRSLTRDTKKHLAALEARERELTGISSLKIRFNRVFGYYLEVTKANQALVPERYVRKQTLVNAERYITPELKELEEQVLEAEERQISLETRYYDELLRSIVSAGSRLRALGEALARVDVLGALAEVAASNGYCRPRMLPAGEGFRIEDGRHPVVEKLSAETFVPNDLILGASGDRDAESGEIVILTGPNMGGKSTYLRQNALIVLMAHAGSFVPARRADIGLVDRIFTRVGASDDLTRGESTFMVEMVETANILHNATRESFVILDEVGRGTATFDGLSLAWAIVEFLHEKAGAKVLFATHYHELTELAGLFGRVVNRTMSVKEWDDRIVFLHRVVPGSADKSYGLHVARLAGMPDDVIDRASRILANLEAQKYDVGGRPRLAAGSEVVESKPGQLGLFAPADELVASILRDVDLERMTPLAALNLLQNLKSRLDR
ncbi:MAG: DNA mismatch repair protein MutS [Acidobacteria bacterium]|nr:DNA mismatch repair protein MutS [Acidobacteriota bacterium]